MSKVANILLQQTNKSFGNCRVKPRGMASFDVIVSWKLFTLTCEVVVGDVPNILSTQDSERLGLLKRVYIANRMKDNVNSMNEEGVKKKMFQNKNVSKWPESVTKCKYQNALDIIKEYKDVFTGTGKAEVHVSFKVDPSIPPVAHPARPVPVVLRDAVRF